jgi:hypothetical protein
MPGRRPGAGRQAGGRRRTSSSSRPSASISASTPCSAARSGSGPVSTVSPPLARACRAGKAQRIVWPRRPRTRIRYRCGGGSRWALVTFSPPAGPARQRAAAPSSGPAWPPPLPLTPSGAMLAAGGGGEARPDRYRAAGARRAHRALTAPGWRRARREQAGPRQVPPPVQAVRNVDSPGRAVAPGTRTGDRLARRRCEPAAPPGKAEQITPRMGRRLTLAGVRLDGQGNQEPQRRARRPGRITPGM